MSFILFFMGLALLGNVYENLTKKDTAKSEPTLSPKVSSYTKRDDYCLDERVERPAVHNHYTQNIYVQQTNHYHTSSKDSKDHTAKVWKELGYSVKYGETYAYKFYGKEIFTHDQVQRMAANRVKYSEDGLANKLLSDTGSKKMAKDILVANYGYSQSDAKSLVGYRGY